MTKCEIRRTSSGVKRWQFVSFAGPKGAESRGIVDLIAIRRDHSERRGVLRPGDRFEIFFIQIKGGSATWPKVGDLKRLREVSKLYGGHVVLASWKKGAAPRFFKLKSLSADRKRAWEAAEPFDLFSGRRRPQASGRVRA